MPSPTSVTRPTVRASSDGSKPSRFFLSAAAMSPALSVSSAMVLFCLRVVSDALEAGLQLLGSGTDGAIDHGGADRGGGAAQYGWIDDDLEVDLFAGGIGQRSGQASLLVRGQRNRRSDFGNLEVLGRRGPGDQLVDDRRQVPRPSGADHHRDQLRRGGRDLAAEQILDDRLTPAGRDLFVGQRVAQIVAALVAAGEAEQLVFDLVDRALGTGDLEQAAGVTLDS